MCIVPDHSKPKTECHTNCLLEDPKTEMAERKEGDLQSDSILLELAANNDLAGFRHAVEEWGAKVDDCGSWYCRQYGSNKMAVVERTPAMIAALFGSLDVLDYILKHIGSHGGNINKVCGADRNTVLHSAAASGSKNVMDTVKLLLSYGADSTLVDVQGLRPFEAKLTSSKQRLTPKKAFSGLLEPGSPSISGVSSSTSGVLELDESLPDSVSEPSLTDLDEIWGLHLADDAGMLSISPFSPSPSPSPSLSPKSPDTSTGKACKPEILKDYPCDSLLLDIKNSIYTTDEFRMYSFKVRPCSRAYSHDWTECPFVHPGENARRRDPRRFHYSCVPCPDFRKGACRHGDGCEYAHGVFESWLHPAQYRTRLCKDGTNCTRRVCFFAHTKEELRPLYLSTECGALSPRLTSSMDVLSMSSPFGLASPSAAFMPPPFSSIAAASGLPSTPPMSPSSVKSLGGTWTPAGVPSLHLPGGSQASRLRASLSARDILQEDVNRLSDMDAQLMCEIASLSTQARLNAAVAASGCGTTSSRAGKYQNIGLNLNSTNLEDSSASNVALSPRSPLQMCLQSSSCGTTPAATGKYQNVGLSVSPTTLEDLIASSLMSSPSSPAHRSLQSQFDIQVQLQNPAHFQSQLHGVLASQLQGHVMPQSAAHSSSLSLGSPSRREAEFLSARSKGSPLSPARAILLQTDKRSQSSKDLEGGLSWSNWGSPTGKPEWGVSGDDLTRFRKSTSLKVKPSEQPDLFWVQNIVEDGSLDADGSPTACAVKMACNEPRDVADHSVMGSWMEQLQVDQLAA